MNLKNVKLVLLDADGVVRDSSKLTYESHAVALDKYNMGERFRKLFSIEEIWHTKGIGKYNARANSLKASIALMRNTKERLGSIVQKYNAESILDQIVKDEISANDDISILEMRDIYYKFFNLSGSSSLISIYPWVEETMERFSSADVETGIFTNSSKDSLKRDLPRKILNSFDVVLGIEDVQNPKPNGEGIRKAASMLGLKAEETLYAGDSTIDIDAAKDAGALSAGVLSGAGLRIHLEGRKPDMIFSNALELSKAFPT